MYIDKYLYKGNAKTLNKIGDSTHISSIGRITNVNFKQPTNFMNPTLIIEIDVNDLFAFNYIYISILNKYYFVKDRRMITKQIAEIDCSEDTIETFKDLILNTSWYVLRGNQNVRYDIKDPDEIEGAINWEHWGDITQYVNFTNTADFLICVVHIDTTTTYSYGVNVDPITTSPSGYLEIDKNKVGYSSHTAYSFLTYQGYQYLCKVLFKDDPALASFIKRIFLMPYVIPDELTTPRSSITLGDTIVNLGQNNVCGGRFNIPIGWKLAASYSGFDYPTDWSEANPFSKYEFFVPYHKMVEIPSNRLGGEIRFYYLYNLELATCQILILDQNYIPIYEAPCDSFFIDLPKDISNLQQLEEQRNNTTLSLILSEVSGAIQIAGGMVSENPILIASGMTSMAGAGARAGLAYSQMHPKATITQPNDTTSKMGFLKFYYHWEMVQTYKDYFLNTPVYQRTNLLAYTGYTKAITPRFETFDGTKAEYDDIIEKVSNGIVIVAS